MTTNWTCCCTSLLINGCVFPGSDHLCSVSLERFTRERMTEQLRNPDTWCAGLVEAGMDPDAPGADYESVKRFFESGEYSITAETDWYLQRAFSNIDGLVETLRGRHWETSITEQGRLIASDNPVVMEGERGQMIGFANAELINYPVSRHVLLTGTLVRVAAPRMNFNYFANMNTLTLLRVDAQAYSTLPISLGWIRIATRRPIGSGS